MRFIKVILPIVGVILATGASAASIQIIAASGDAMPDGNGTLDRFGKPALNDDAQVAFRAHANTGLSLDNGAVLLSGAAPLPLVQIARDADTLPGGDAKLYGLSQGGVPALNRHGRVAFGARWYPIGNANLVRDGIFTGTRASGSLRTLARVGQISEGLTLDGLGKSYARSLWTLALNDRDEVSFPATFSGPGVGFDNDTAILRVDTARTGWDVLAREGDFIPEGTPRLSTFTDHTMNNRGQIAFGATLIGNQNGGYDNEGMYRATGGGISQLARTQYDGTFTGLAFPGPINDLGYVGFYARVASPSGGAALHALYCSDGVFLSLMAQSTHSIANASGTISTISRYFDLNDREQAALVANVQPAPGQVTREALLRSDNGVLYEILREGQPLSRGATVRGFNYSRFALNEKSQIAILCPTTVGDTVGQALLLHDRFTGLTEIAHTGDALLGSTITELGFSGTFAPASNDPEYGLVPRQQRGLNNNGAVAFQFTLANGRQGIALWSSEEVRGQQIRLIGRNIRIRWATTSGSLNYLETSPSPSGQFTPIAGPITAPAGGGIVQMEYTHIDAITNRTPLFYRIRREP